MDGSLHASCVVVGEAGILIRGPSGAGKSALARRLVATARLAGRFARLVADDRVRVESRHGRLVARPVPAIAGLVEVRGHGIVAAAHEPGAVLRLVVDCLAAAPERFPGPESGTIVLEGVALARIAGLCGPDLADLALARLHGADGAIGAI
jgi:hypothetical protein